MELREIKKNFMYDFVSWGVEKVPGGHPKLEKWMREFLEPVGKIGDRRVNHFKLGCEVDFLMINKKPQKNPETGEITYSSHMLPATQYVKGNGLLSHAEANDAFRIRMLPSRSVLELVGGIWRGLQATVDWMPEYRGANWLSGGFKFRTSLAGNINFHRGRGRIQAIHALDSLTMALVEVGVFDGKEQGKRVQGDDTRFRRFGVLGDVRVMSYGFQYRVFPSFLESPWQAFLVLTLAKLAVVGPEMLRNWNLVEGHGESKIRNLLAYYQGRDEDARLAYEIWNSGRREDKKQEMKAAWKVLIDRPPLRMEPQPLRMAGIGVWTVAMRELLTGKEVKVPEVGKVFEGKALKGKGWVEKAISTVLEAKPRVHEGKMIFEGRGN